MMSSLWPEGGGGELASYLFAKTLTKEGVNLKIITPKQRQYLKELDVYPISFTGFGKFSIPYIDRKASEIIASADIIYVTSNFFSIIPYIKRKFKKAVVAHIHSYFPSCPVGHLYNFAHKSICSPQRRNCSKCILLYERARRNFIQSTGSAIFNSALNRIFIDNILKADALIYASYSQKVLFEKHISLYSSYLPKTFVIFNPLPNIRPVLIEGDDIAFFGGLDPIKGFNILLNAWKYVRKTTKSKIIIASSQAIPYNLEEIGLVRYPPLKGAALKRIYKMSRVVVVPSIAPETASYVSLEACMYERPLIASNIGGIPEYVGGLPGVKLISPNATALVKALEWVLSLSREKVQDLGAKNRNYLIKRYIKYNPTKELMKIFESYSSLRV